VLVTPPGHNRVLYRISKEPPEVVVLLVEHRHDTCRPLPLAAHPDNRPLGTINASAQ
jgi:hypothetical protein